MDTLKLLYLRIGIADKAIEQGRPLKAMQVFASGKRVFSLDLSDISS